jgi:hypothetical protein
VSTSLSKVLRYMRLRLLLPSMRALVSRVVVDVSYATPQVHRIVNVALHQEYPSDIIFIFS